MTHYLHAAEQLRKNPEQWAVYESRGHCVVLAGPGSGKTKVLTVKMARLVAEEVHRPQGVACVTYNNECARELRRRLELLGVNESDSLFIGTLHGFCLRHVLSPFGKLAGIDMPSPLCIASESDKVRVLGLALKRLGMRGNAETLLWDVDKMRREFLDRVPEEGWDTTDQITQLSLQYENELLSSGLIDFEGIILKSLHIVESNEWVRRCLRAKFPVIVVDEYQDLGRALHRIVLRLCIQHGVRLLAVGDPDQSIYGFNGAHPELLEELAMYPAVEQVRLKLNYRSGTRIVEASKAALGAKRDYEAATDAEGKIEYHRSESGFDGEVDLLIDDVIPSLTKVYDPGDIVILYPSRHEGTRIENALQKSGYEYVRLGRNSAYPRTPCTRLIEDFARWCAGGWQNGNPRLSRLLSRWVKIQSTRDLAIQREERLKIVRFLFENKDQCHAFAWLSSFEQSVLLQGNCLERLSVSGEIDGFESLKSACGPGGKFSHFTVANLGGQAGSPRHLNLLTLHSSKGCEFTAVVMIGADQGRVPSHRADAGGIEEARRLFYVGVSRAREEVRFICSKRIEGDRFQQGPSQFLIEMARALKR